MVHEKQDLVTANRDVCRSKPILNEVIRASVRTRCRGLWPETRSSRMRCVILLSTGKAYEYSIFIRVLFKFCQVSKKERQHYQKDNVAFSFSIAAKLHTVTNYAPLLGCMVCYSGNWESQEPSLSHFSVRRLSSPLPLSLSIKFCNQLIKRASSVTAIPRGSKVSLS